MQTIAAPIPLYGAANVTPIPTAMMRGYLWVTHHETCRDDDCGYCAHLSTRLLAAVDQEVEREGL
jgi:hypothetical protein